jgi:hypothetical protein
MSRDSFNLDKNLYKVTRKYKISILPITPNFDIDNLYPLTDHVELWNIFIVGNDKTYILANVNDPHILIPNVGMLPNKQAQNILPDEMMTVLNSIWTKTLTGKQLQFYMVWNSKLYFINTYPFFNGKSAVIGAIMFMRAFESMPETKFITTLDGYLIPPRISMDVERDIAAERERSREQREPSGMSAEERELERRRELSRISTTPPALRTEFGIKVPHK